MPEFPAYDFEIVATDILAVIDFLGIQKAHFNFLEYWQCDFAKNRH